MCCSCGRPRRAPRARPPSRRRRGRPLLGATWPELVRARLAGACEAAGGGAAAGALAALAATEYGDLPGRQRLALLEALVHAAADVDAVRAHIAAGCGGADEAALPRAAPLGTDGAGRRFFRLGAEAGAGRLFVEAPGGGGWAWYPAAQLPALLVWLDGGSDAERALAEDVHEAFQAELAEAAAAAPEPGDAPEAAGAPTGGAAGGGDADEAAAAAERPAPAAAPGLAEGGDAADGYRLARPLPPPAAALRAELGALLAAARWWEKPGEWLAARGAVRAELARAADGRCFARLAWLVEDLTYDDLLKGTGWGRRRGWCRERLEDCRTLAQARCPIPYPTLPKICRAPAERLLEYTRLPQARCPWLDPTLH